MPIYKLLFCSIFVSCLLGCGGAGSDNENSNEGELPEPDEPTSGITRYPLQVIGSSVGELIQVPVFQNVPVARGEILSLSEAELISASTGAQCDIPQNVGLEWRLTQNTQGTCLYQYQVLGGVAAKTYLVAIHTSEQGQLPTLTTTATVNETAEQVISVPPGGELQLITVLGQGEAEVNDNIIQFQGNAAGRLLVLYQVSDVNGNSQMGELRITVLANTETNTPPVVTFDDVVQLPSEKGIIKPKQVTDIDGDLPQLVMLSAPDGGVAVPALTDPSAPGYYENTALEFTAALPGSYAVYATYHDHKGGYTSLPITIEISGDAAFSAGDATFKRDTYRERHAFTIDLRSHVIAADISKVEFLGAEIIQATGGLKFEPGSIEPPSTEAPILTYTYPGGQLNGTIAISYTVRFGDIVDEGTIWFTFGDIAVPVITRLEASNKLEYLESVSGDSDCNYCLADKTQYEWRFNGGIIAGQTLEEVPIGYLGDVLTLSATPQGEGGISGETRTLTFAYPLHDVSFALSATKAKETESILLTYTGDAYSFPIVSIGESRDRQLAPQSDNVARFLLDDGTLVDEVQITEAGQVLRLVPQAEAGALPKGGLETDIHARYETRQGVEEEYRASVIFTTLTSPDSELANRWGHMRESVALLSGGNISRPLLDAELAAEEGERVNYHHEWYRTGLTPAQQNQICQGLESGFNGWTFTASGVMSLSQAKELIQVFTDESVASANTSTLAQAYGWQMYTHILQNADYREDRVYTLMSQKSMNNTGNYTDLLGRVVSDAVNDALVMCYMGEPVLAGIKTVANPYIFDVAEGFPSLALEQGQFELVMTENLDGMVFNTDNIAALPIDSSNGIATLNSKDADNARLSVMYQGEEIASYRMDFRHYYKLISASIVHSSSNDAGCRANGYTWLPAAAELTDKMWPSRAMGTLFNEWGKPVKLGNNKNKGIRVRDGDNYSIDPKDYEFHLFESPVTNSTLRSLYCR